MNINLPILGLVLARKILLTPNAGPTRRAGRVAFDKTNIVPEQKHIVKPTPAVCESDTTLK